MPDMQVISLAAVLASAPSASSDWSAVLAAALGGAASVLTLGLVTTLFLRQRIEARRSELEAANLVRSIRELEYNQERLSREQVSHINVNVERLAEDLLVPPQGELIIRKNATRGPEQLIREISHSLNTPLGQIELTIARFMEMGDARGLPISLQDAAATARRNIQACRAVLAAYRELTSVASQWELDDLQSTLEAVTDTFLSQAGRSSDGIRQDIHLPKSIAGYSNYLILSLLLPLIQNAVESASPNTQIKCWVERSDTSYRLHVSNVVDSMPDLELLRTDGYTTKGEGHEGLGLSSVRTLLARQAHLGARLEFRASDDNYIIAIINLPQLEGYNK